MAQQTDETKIAVISKDIEYIKKDVGEIKDGIKNLSGYFVSKQEFNDFVKGEFATVKKIVYGFVSMILVAVVGAILALVLNQ